MPRPRFLLLLIPVFLFLFVAHRLAVIPHVAIDFSSLSHSSSINTNTLADDAEYRRLLSIARPIDTALHSPTLGIANAIYVISLPRRIDRRESMTNLLSRALDLEFEFVNATDYKTEGEGKEIVDRLYRRLRWQRDRIDDREADAEEWPKSELKKGDPSMMLGAFPFKWAEDVEASPQVETFGVRGADLWEDEVWDEQHPITIKDDSVVMAASVQNTLRLKEPITGPNVATWHSHIKAIRKIVEHKHSAAIIFEDDVDLEFNIERLIRPQFPHLPPNEWDIVWLGHCWSNSELTYPAISPSAPMLHPTHHTLCLHGYVVSLRGAIKILRYLRSPDFAYSRSIDQAVKDLVQMHKITSWSVVPPVVVQTKKDMSDNVGGLNAKSKQLLMDSTIERMVLANKRLAGVKEVYSDDDI